MAGQTQTAMQFVLENGRSSKPGADDEASQEANKEENDEAERDEASLEKLKIYLNHIRAWLGESETEPKKYYTLEIRDYFNMERLYFKKRKQDSEEMNSIIDNANDAKASEAVRSIASVSNEEKNETQLEMNASDNNAPYVELEEAQRKATKDKENRENNVAQKKTKYVYILTKITVFCNGFFLVSWVKLRQNEREENKRKQNKK